MPPSALSTEAKAAVKANLELELKSRKEKLQAMCDAQVASLRSRLERRVNRIPASKRSMKLVDLLDSAISATKPMAAKTARSAATRRQPAPVPVAAAAPVPVPVPVRPTAPTTAARKTRTAPAVTKEATKAVTKPVPKATRGKKRPSDDGDKENEELDVPKKRTKTVAPAKATTARSTRAASRKVVPSQVLSPKPDNGRPTVARTRRQR